MGHELEMNDTMVSGVQAPWHYAETKGRVTLDPREGIPWGEITKVAGLDWNVAKAPLYAFTGPDEEDIDLLDMTPVPNRYATYRTDNKLILGTVTDFYQVIQNHQLADFVKDVVDSSDATFATAGSLRGNRIVWFLLKLPDEVLIGGLKSEKLDHYLLVTSGHDGFHEVMMTDTYVRVVCMNTLRLALGGGAAYEASHYLGVDLDVQKGREALGLSFANATKIHDFANRLVEQTVTADEVDEFLKRLVPEPKLTQKRGGVMQARKPEWIERERQLRARQRADILTAYTETPDLADIRGTRYGLLQGVSQYEQHNQRVAASPNRSAVERRFEIAMLDGKTLTSRAAELLA